MKVAEKVIVRRKKEQLVADILKMVIDVRGIGIIGVLSTHFSQVSCYESEQFCTFFKRVFL